MKILSFKITSNYASFRDPSVTTNQVAYYIPSKSAIVGILGAIYGIKRSNILGNLYSNDYLKFYSQIKVGLKVENIPKKIVYFTNHRSFKKPKKYIKPVKKEILKNPEYKIYVCADEEIVIKLEKIIKTHTYKFSPYLGHAYCMAKINDKSVKFYDVEKIENVLDEKTDCVVLDESETYKENFKLSLNPDYDDGGDGSDDDSDGGFIIVERHLHHFYLNNIFQSRVLKHWIPLKSTICTIENIEQNTLSEFYKIDKKVCCFY